jgi:hypothetical protein
VEHAATNASATFDTRIMEPSIGVAKAAIVGESGRTTQKRLHEQESVSIAYGFL